jgi:hypothetical protein
MASQPDPRPVIGAANVATITEGCACCFSIGACERLASVSRPSVCVTPPFGDRTVSARVADELDSLTSL